MENFVPEVERWLQLDLAAVGMRVASALLVLLIGVVLAQAAARAARAAFRRTPLRMRELVVNFLTRAVHTVIVVFAGVVALGTLGLDIGPLIAGIGITGFVVGFAFKDSLSNLAAGLLLLFYQPFEVGDLVEVGGIGGKVRDMSIVATELRMPDGRLAIVPNSRIWNNPIINFNRLGKRQIEWLVGVAYGADIGMAAEALQAAVAGDGRVLADPAPQVVVNAVSKARVELAVRAWVSPPHFAEVSSGVRRALKEALDARGVEVA